MSVTDLRVLRTFTDVFAAFGAAFVVEASIAFLGLRGTLDWMERSDEPCTSGEIPDLRRQARLIGLAYRVTPFPGTCLRRALVQYWLGRRRGFPVQFVMGVRVNASFEAHAWVENGSERSDDTSLESFAEILRSPSVATPPVRSNSSPSVRTGEHICLACGLCCDGTLFRHVPLAAEEAVALRRRALPVLDSKNSLPQPCAAHRDARCQVYAVRPRTCSEFRCGVLERFLAGQLSEESCLRTIAATKELASIVRAQLDGKFDVPMRQVLDEGLRTGRIDDPAWRRENARLLMDAKLLEMLIRREFGAPPASDQSEETLAPPARPTSA